MLSPGFCQCAPGHQISPPGFQGITKSTTRCLNMSPVSSKQYMHPVSDNFPGVSIHVPGVPKCPGVLLHVPGVSQIHCSANSLQRCQSTASDGKEQSAVSHLSFTTSNVQEQLAMSKHNQRCPSTSSQRCPNTPSDAQAPLAMFVVVLLQLIVVVVQLLQCYCVVVVVLF